MFPFPRRLTRAGSGSRRDLAPRCNRRLDRPERARSISACRRARPLSRVAVVSPLLTVLSLLLLFSGCGQSSTTTSTQSQASQSSAPSTSAPPQQATAGSSTSRSPATSTSTAAGVVTGSSGGVTVSLHVGTHHPRAGHSWPIRFTATRSGHAVRASVSYQYLFAGQVVAHRSHYTFIGRFSDVFVWPSSAVGYPLTFRAVIVAEGATIDLDYPVQVTG